MLSTDAFNYVNVLDKAADASWSRENILTNNIANVNTPGYKRKDLNFENTLKTELGRCKQVPGFENERRGSFQTESIGLCGQFNYSYRLDGSNVDIDTEEVELASEQIRYQGITAGINGQFDRMRS